MKKLSIVGCLPSPVGGVSVFCERLTGLIIQSDDVKVDFYDIYKGVKENSFSCNSNFKLMTPKFFNFFYPQAWLLFMLVWNKPNTIFINFSRESSLFFVFLLSFFLRERRVYLCLHHGELNKKNGIMGFFYKKALENVYRVFSLSPNQYQFYEEYIPKEKVVTSSSYLPPISQNNSVFIDKSIFKIIISGNSAPHYNVITTLENVANIISKDSLKHYLVTISIYGNKCELFDAELVDAISKIETTNIEFNITYDLGCNQFNELLKSQDLYIRNTSVDSFGILVADAINFGIKVLASDVCPRYCGTYLFEYENSTSFVTAFRHILNENLDMVNCSEIDEMHFPYQSILEALSE